MFLFKRILKSQYNNIILPNSLNSIRNKTLTKFNQIHQFSNYNFNFNNDSKTKEIIKSKIDPQAELSSYYNTKNVAEYKDDLFENLREGNKIINKVLKQDEKSLSFKEFKFIPEIYHVLENLKFYAPTSIQTVAIPKIMEKKNIFFSSQTGTGKTLTYLIPVINELKLQEKALCQRLTTAKRPRVLIMVPSRELAQQVEEVCKLFVYDVPLVVESFYVGKDFGIEKEAGKRGMDILITTPERFKNHWSKSNIYSTKLTHLIIDELDTLLDSGYGDFLKSMVDQLLSKNEKEALPNTNTDLINTSNLNDNTKNVRQIIMASTTLTPSIDTYLSTLFSPHPTQNFIKIIDKSTNHNLSNVKHEFLHVTDYDKYPTLIKILQDNDKIFKQNMSVIIFCNNVSCARKTELILSENNFTTACLHGDIPPIRRRFELQKFKQRRTKILVCTDLIARGLDFPFVFLVINFDFPKTLSDYLHRAGRTGRQGRNGVVVSFYRNFNLFVIEKIKKAHQLNLPMEIQNSMYSIRKALNNTDKSLTKKKKITEGIKEKSIVKNTEKTVIHRLRERKEKLDKFKIKSQNDRDTIFRKMNERNQRKTKKARKNIVDRLKQRKKIYK